MGRLTLCLGVPSSASSLGPTGTCDLCGPGWSGGIPEGEGILTAASCHLLQGAAGLACVCDGLLPKLGATSHGRCLCVTCQGCENRHRGIFVFVTLWVPVVSHNSVTFCLIFCGSRLGAYILGVLLSIEVLGGNSICSGIWGFMVYLIQ